MFLKNYGMSIGGESVLFIGDGLKGCSRRLLLDVSAPHKWSPSINKPQRTRHSTTLCTVMITSNFQQQIAHRFVTRINRKHYNIHHLRKAQLSSGGLEILRL